MAELDMAKGRGIAKDLIANDGDKEVEPRRLVRSDRKKFDAEFGMMGPDLVFHFFRPKDEEDRLASDVYWMQIFPSVLDPVAQKHFNAGQDRLSAEFIKDYELDSWYLIARGYDHIMDIPAYVEKFYVALEAGLTSKET